MSLDPTQIVRRGIWLYDNTLPLQVVITLEAFWPGTGDYEDPPEIANDREVSCFQVWLDTDPNRFIVSGGYFLSLSAAMDHAAQLTNGTLTWDGL